jgi:3-deoxy-D-manno-octulosonic-acid transferase
MWYRYKRRISSGFVAQIKRTGFLMLIYNLILFIVALFAVPYYGMKILFTGKYRRSFSAKFGFVKSDLVEKMKGCPRIWIHAVSVGEVTAAAPIIDALRFHFPEARLILSTSTETGQDMANKLVRSATSIIYYPLDIPFVIRKVIDLVNPDLFITTETELWPNFIQICRARGIRIIMVNGRLSPGSFKGYAATRFFWKHIVNIIDEAGMISEIDAKRMRALGMSSEKVHVLGNAKYDSLAAKVSPAVKDEIARRLNIALTERVFVAGSTHEGEEKIVLTVYRELLKTYPDLKLILIPRHIERTADILSYVKEFGFEGNFITITEINRGKKRLDENVVIIDVIGELFKIYSLASVVFCGGSLVPKGGQNILEAAAWGKIVFYGPFMGDFKNERTLLEETGAGITVKSSVELLNGILKVMADPETFTRIGEKGKATVTANMGASQRYVKLIETLLAKKRLV